ncbi:MAG: nucleotidyltransferase family protein [Nanoarchaeota archaeon]
MAKKTENLTIKQIVKIAVPILKRNGIKKAGIFGSYARGEAKKKSDIDMLVQPPNGMGFGFFGLNLELEEKLGKKVDLVSYNGLSPYLKDKILEQEVRIL